MKIILVMLLTLTILPAYAAKKTVMLSVPGMTCAACPITVRAALSKVPGVRKIKFDLKKRVVVVAFDGDKTSINSLTKATKDAGYPSTPVDKK